jgi:uncharacterized protein
MDKSEVPVIDCDIHPNPVRKRDLLPYLDDYWRDYMIASKFKGHLPTVDITLPVNGGLRADSKVPEGGPACSSIDFFRQQVMDEYNYSHAILFTDGTFFISGAPQREMATALASAYNDWLIEHWLSKDSRVYGTVLVAAQDPEAAAREIDRVGSHPKMVQVGLGMHSPYGGWGDPRYHPIWEAAVRNNLVVCFHTTGAGGTGLYPTGPIGIPPYFVEFQSTNAIPYQAQLANMIFSGLFEKFPGIKMAFIEAGFAWVPGLTYMMDTQWRAVRREVPWVKRPPSEYVREHIWFGTQPMIEPEPADHKYLEQLIDMVGSDKLLFASDYPHWEFDSPVAALKGLSRETRNRIRFHNAKKLYNLPDPS